MLGGGTEFSSTVPGPKGLLVAFCFQGFFFSFFRFLVFFLSALLQMDMECYTNKTGAGWPGGSRKGRTQAWIKTEPGKAKKKMQAQTTTHRTQNPEPRRTAQPGASHKTKGKTLVHGTQDEQRGWEMWVDVGSQWGSRTKWTNKAPSRSLSQLPGSLLYTDRKSCSFPTYLRIKYWRPSQLCSLDLIVDISTPWSYRSHYNLTILNAFKRHP